MQNRKRIRHTILTLNEKKYISEFVIEYKDKHPVKVDIHILQ